MVALACLALLSALSVAMVVVRIAYTGDSHYSFMLWNLFLAWIPFGLALLVYDGHRRGRSGLAQLVPGVLWLLFLPNAPYIVTDYVHLRRDTSVPSWYDIILVTSAAWTGLVLGFASLFLVHSVLRRTVGPRLGWLAVVGAIALCSFGIYLGRILRWNSWDVFSRPSHLLADVRERVADPLEHPTTFAMTLLLAAFLTLAYVLVYNLAHLRGSELERRRG